MKTYDIAATLEYFQGEGFLKTAEPGQKLDDLGLVGFEVISSENYNDEQGYAKAIAIRNTATNEVYVHFYGTGDGNWVENAAAYGAKPQPSDMQEWALSFFEKIAGATGGTLYVSGHSQGGNNAQFVTMRTEQKYADRISECISLNGPGFSNQFVKDTKDMEMYKKNEGEYERRCNKIYGYYCENDYVSTLGQVSIVPDDDEHITFIEYTGEDGDFQFPNWHMINGMVRITYDSEGRPVVRLAETCEDDSAWRKFIAEAVEKIKDFPPGDQARIAELVMKICEDVVGAQEPIKSGMTSDEFNELKKLLSPFLVEVLEIDPELIVNMLKEWGFDDATIKSIMGLITQINSYSKEERENIIEGLLLTVDYENLDLPHFLIGGVGALITVLPTVLRAHGFNDKVIDIIISVYTAFEKAINAVIKWYKDTFCPGEGYVNDNPYFKVDTEKLRNYAGRVARVNSRLKNLDKELRDLYWQVGFEDLLTILYGNLLTNESGTLNKIVSYLNDTADDFENADNKAYQYMGG